MKNLNIYLNHNPVTYVKRIIKQAKKGNKIEWSKINFWMPRLIKCLIVVTQNSESLKKIDQKTIPTPLEEKIIESIKDEIKNSSQIQLAISEELNQIHQEELDKTDQIQLAISEELNQIHQEELDKTGQIQLEISGEPNQIHQEELDKTDQKLLKQIIPIIKEQINKLEQKQQEKSFLKIKEKEELLGKRQKLEQLEDIGTEKKLKQQEQIKQLKEQLKQIELEKQAIQVLEKTEERSQKEKEIEEKLQKLELEIEKNINIIIFKNCEYQKKITELQEILSIVKIDATFIVIKMLNFKSVYKDTTLFKSKDWLCEILKTLFDYTKIDFNSKIFNINKDNCGNEKTLNKYDEDKLSLLDYILVCKRQWENKYTIIQNIPFENLEQKTLKDFFEKIQFFQILTRNNKESSKYYLSKIETKLLDICTKLKVNSVIDKMREKKEKLEQKKIENKTYEKWFKFNQNMEEKQTIPNKLKDKDKTLKCFNNNQLDGFSLQSLQDKDQSSESELFDYEDYNFQAEVAGDDDY